MWYKTIFGSCESDNQIMTVIFFSDRVSTKCEESLNARFLVGNLIIFLSGQFFTIFFERINEAL